MLRLSIVLFKVWKLSSMACEVRWLLTYAQISPALQLKKQRWERGLGNGKDWKAECCRNVASPYPERFQASCIMQYILVRSVKHLDVLVMWENGDNSRAKKRTGQGASILRPSLSYCSFLVEGGGTLRVLSKPPCTLELLKKVHMTYSGFCHEIRNRFFNNSNMQGGC